MPLPKLLLRGRPAYKPLYPLSLSPSPAPLVSVTSSAYASFARVQHNSFKPLSTLPTSRTQPSNKPITFQAARMSTMKATGGHSEACCNIPPIVSSGYSKKGEYETIDGKKTYVTGPVKEASKGIIVIMDIFVWHFVCPSRICELSAHNSAHI